MQLTEEIVTAALQRAGGVLRSGHHAPPNCEVCVRELRTFCLGLPWSDHPDGPAASPTDTACQTLNDAAWSSDEARTEGCLPMVHLSEAAAPEGWAARYVELTIRRVLPMALRAAATAAPSHAEALEAAAVRCERDGDKEAARAGADAARTAASWASDAAWAEEAARTAWALRAADAASWEAWVAADAVSRALRAADAALRAADAALRAADAAARAADAAAAVWADDVLRVAVGSLLEAHGRAPVVRALP